MVPTEAELRAGLRAQAERFDQYRTGYLQRAKLPGGLLAVCTPTAEAAEG